MENGDLRIHDGEWLQNCWKSGRKKKILYVALISLVVILLIFVLYLLLIPQKFQTCRRKDCESAAEEIRKYVDPSRNPCDDFYRFACGNFLKQPNNTNLFSSTNGKAVNEIQSEIRGILEEQMYEDDPRALNLAKRFYRSCMNQTNVEKQGLRPVRQILKEMGGWPSIMTHFWTEDDFEWTEAVRNLRRIGITPNYFFRVVVEPEERPKSDDKYEDTRREKYILKIKDPLYGPAKIDPKTKMMYLNYMADVALQFGVAPDVARKEQSEVLELILRLGKISEESRSSNKSNIHNVMTVAELQNEFPNLNWRHYLNGITATENPITTESIVSISDPIYLRKVLQLLETTPQKILANFIAWQTVQNLLYYLPGKILERAYEYLTHVNGKFNPDPRWKICVKETEERLTSAISAAYVQRFLDGNTMSNAYEILREIKTQWKEQIDRSPWMDEETKTKSVAALNANAEELITIDELLDTLKRNRITYDNISLVEDKWLEVALNLDRIRLDRRYGRIGEIVKNDWMDRQGFVMGLNVAYLPRKNLLKLPVGIFRGIYYRNNRPDYLNYGAVGTLIGHKMSHIVTEAERPDLEGKLRSWWSTNTKEKYSQHLNCLSNQYGKFQLTEFPQHHNNPSKTLNEDIADLGGVKVAYEAYESYVYQNGVEQKLPGLPYTPNQLFWIASALPRCSKLLKEPFGDDPFHSPQPFRVNGPLRNLDEFAVDFGCGTGTYMNPVDKCRVW